MIGTVDDDFRYIFLNDDCVVMGVILEALASSEADVCWAASIDPSWSVYPCTGPTGAVVHLKEAADDYLRLGQRIPISDHMAIEICGIDPFARPGGLPAGAIPIPLGACFSITALAFWASTHIDNGVDIEGFDERFKNGMEDVDLFLRCHEHHRTFEMIGHRVRHAGMASHGRMDHIKANRDLLAELWPSERLEALCPRSA